MESRNQVSGTLRERWSLLEYPVDHHNEAVYKDVPGSVDKYPFVTTFAVDLQDDLRHDFALARRRGALDH